MMALFTFLRIFIDTLNPLRYKGLSQRSFIKTLTFFLMISLFYVLILGVVNIPSYISVYNNLDSGSSSFKEFSVSFNIKTNDSIVLSENPSMVIDSSYDKNFSEDDLLITDKDLYINTFFTTKKFSIVNIDLLKNLQVIKRNTLILALLFVPSILLIVYLFVIIKYVLISFILTLLGIVIINIYKQNESLFSIFKIALHALTIYYLVNIVSTVYHVKYIGLIAYIVMFIFGIISLRETSYGGSIDDE